MGYLFIKTFFSPAKFHQSWVRTLRRSLNFLLRLTDPNIHL